MVGVMGIQYCISQIVLSSPPCGEIPTLLLIMKVVMVKLVMTVVGVGAGVVVVLITMMTQVCKCDNLNQHPVETTLRVTLP